MAFGLFMAPKQYTGKLARFETSLEYWISHPSTNLWFTLEALALVSWNAVSTRPRIDHLITTVQAIHLHTMRTMYELALIAFSSCAHRTPETANKRLSQTNVTSTDAPRFRSEFAF